jgi:hypothetical protein
MLHPDPADAIAPVLLRADIRKLPTVNLSQSPVKINTLTANLDYILYLF